MQFKTLSIHNIASISDAEIDFCGDVLGNAPVFLICGETGAGKSTVLDAICLALYGDTPRMTSVSKESIEVSDGTSNRYYTNDNSQLLRRGTGEGFCKLIFTGNDGKDYEAVWEIHRNHNKPEKSLQRPRRGLRAVDNSFTDHRINEIDAKVEEVTGLRYEQFCRTVMLAQGEFTKFLKSSREEKSEILEKLTGTEVYSQIGVMIAEKYNSRKNAWLEIKKEVESVALMSEEELASNKEKQERLVMQSATLASERDEALAKSLWLTTFASLSKILSDSVKDKEKLASLVSSESFKDDLREVELYEASAEGRRLLTELENIERNLGKKVLLLPDFENIHKGAVEKEAECLKKVEANNLSMIKVQKTLDSLALEELGKRLAMATEADKVLTEILTEYEKLKTSEETSEMFVNDLTGFEKTREEAMAKLDSLKLPLANLEAERERFATALQHGEISVSDVVKSIRKELKEGDSCPVCGSVIDKELKEDTFESMLLPLREGKKLAEDRLISLRSEINMLKGKIKEAGEGISRLKNEIEKWSKRIVIIRDRISALREKAGIESISDSMVADECCARKSILVKEISEIRAKQEIGNNTLKELQRIQKEGKILGDTYVACKEKSGKTFSALEVHKADIKSDETQRDDLKKRFESFMDSAVGVDLETLKRLSALDAGEMRRRRETCNNSLESLKAIESKVKTISEQVKAHEAKRPVLGESETVETVKLRLEEINGKIKETDMEAGRTQEVLRNDSKVRDNLSKKRKRMDDAREELDRWEGLYNKLGDQKGAKFRAVAQSFILRSLLENANMYMCNFTDRYSLTCNPGTLAILVRDSYKPSDPQPASILSGGESFMASLSLALALANLRSGGMGADILFIDEGFGTLSSEYLGNVMDTLEKLHQIGGRKVGLISHVADMKERIPVHINVCRESPALSRVTVTCGEY